MTLEEYIARLKSLRAAVADLRARMFTEGVDGAPVNLQTYGGDLIGIYATLTDAPAGLEDSEEKEEYLWSFRPECG